MTKDYLWLNLRELPYFRSMLRSVEARLYEGVEIARPCLDLGCGDGHFTEVAFDSPIDIGVDLDLGIMREAQKREHYRVLVQADASQLPIKNGSIASVLSNSVLEHMPDLDLVLADVARVLAPGGTFVFTVPNPGYRTELSVPRSFRRLKLERIARAYESWFMRMSRTIHLDYEEGWNARLARVGLVIKHTFRYFSPAALRALEWGHYFSSPTLLPRLATGRWILAPTRWNLWLTDRWVRRYYEEPPTEQGTYSFYLAGKP